MTIFLTAIFIILSLIALTHRSEKINEGKEKKRWYDL